MTRQRSRPQGLTGTQERQTQECQGIPSTRLCIDRHTREKSHRLCRKKDCTVRDIKQGLKMWLELLAEAKPRTSLCRP